MTLKFFNKWIKVLASGEYKRVKGKLRRSGKNKKGELLLKHCCLGVAKDMCAIDQDLEYSDLKGWNYEEMLTNKALKKIGLPRIIAEDLTIVNDTSHGTGYGKVIEVLKDRKNEFVGKGWKKRFIEGQGYANIDDIYENIEEW